jgi:hypothetical protein
MAITHSPAFTQTSRGIIKAAETSLVMPECPHNIGGPSGTIREAIGGSQKKIARQKFGCYFKKIRTFLISISLSFVSGLTWVSARIWVT